MGTEAGWLYASISFAFVMICAGNEMCSIDFTPVLEPESDKVSLYAAGATSYGNTKPDAA